MADVNVPQPQEIPHYTVCRDDGAPVDGEFLVIRIDNDWRMRKALAAAARILKPDKPELADGFIRTLAPFASPEEQKTWK